MDKQSPERRKKMAAPIIIAVLFPACLTVYGIAIFTASELPPVMLLFALPFIALGIKLTEQYKSENKKEPVFPFLRKEALRIMMSLCVRLSIYQHLKVHDADNCFFFTFWTKQRKL